MKTRPVTILQHEPEGPPGSIAVALRDLGVPFEVRRLDEGDPLPTWPDETAGLISLGGAMQVTEQRQYPFLGAEISLMRHIVHEGGPVWGICLGAQLLTVAGGGDVFKRAKPELGWVSIDKLVDDPLLRGISSPFTAFVWHQYSCRLPATAHLVAQRNNGLQVFRAGGRAWATQFHPEIDADMAPYFVDGKAKEFKALGTEFIETLRKETAERLPGNVAFCRKLTENFILTSGLLPADQEKRKH